MVLVLVIVFLVPPEEEFIHEIHVRLSAKHNGKYKASSIMEIEK